MDLALARKAVLVSGASRGIGLAISEAFIAEGAGVAMVARGAADLAAAGTRVGTASVFPIAADMTVDQDIVRAFDEAETALGPLDIVVANLGGGASIAGTAVPRQEWERVMTLNFLGAASLATLAAERMGARGRGALVFVSSIAGLEALGAPAPYAAAKSALQALVKSYARALGGKGVRVNAVAPGNIYFAGGTWDRRIRADEAGVEAMIEREVPLGRMGKPSEVADAVLFLASARAAYITGATLVVDGGQTRAIL